MEHSLGSVKLAAATMIAIAKMSTSMTAAAAAAITSKA